MMLVTTASELDGYKIQVTKGLAQGATFENMLHHAEQLGANAILGADYSNSLPEEVHFHGTAVLVGQFPKGGRTFAQPLLPLS